MGRDRTKEVIVMRYQPNGGGHALGGKAFPVANARAVGLGALMMLVSLAYPWYAFRITVGGSIAIDVAQLIWRTGDWDFVGLGSALTLLSMILFALIIVVSIFYSLQRGVATVRLWGWLGGLSAVCVIANALYILNGIHDASGRWVNIPSGGFVIALIGTLIVIFGAATVKRGSVR